ncbi:MAG: DNA cytosine methyltransferase [Tannerella sp.]|jgi:DNA (cytosine-5)-methyltransferase 1|nr:DNA cytosine methyltransferase [Tannerella sp.]
MQIVDLFSGMGGFSLAGKWVGWDTVQFVEINPFCRRILEYHFRDVPVFEDVKKFSIDELKKSKWNPSENTIVCGGFPCQPFSNAGRRKGAADDRHLWPEVIRLVREIKPAWFIGENVAGITSMVQPGSEVEVASGKTLFGEDYKETVSRERYIIDTIRKDLKQAGYKVWPFIIPACAVGAPHRRDRIWIVGYNKNFNRTGKTVAHRADAGHESVSEWENGVYEPPTVADANGERPSGRGSRIEKVAETSRCAETGRLGYIGTSSHANGVQRRQNDKGKQSGQSEQDIPNWQRFPTQSPICRKYDGLSSELVGITFSAWRRQAIEALGNSIVPHVAHKFFKIIDNI